MRRAASSFGLTAGLAEPGYYEVEVTTGAPADQVGFTLSLNAPLRPLEDSGVIFDLPSGIAAQRAYMPSIQK